MIYYKCVYTAWSKVSLRGELKVYTLKSIEWKGFHRVQNIHRSQKSLDIFIWNFYGIHPILLYVKSGITQKKMRSLQKLGFFSDLLISNLNLQFCKEAVQQICKWNSTEFSKTDLPGNKTFFFFSWGTNNMLDWPAH